MPDRINKLQKILSLFFSRGIQQIDITSRWFAVCVHGLHSSEFQSRSKTGAYFPSAPKPTRPGRPSRIEPGVAIPKIRTYTGRTYAWLTFSHVLGHPWLGVRGLGFRPGVWHWSRNSSQPPGQSQGWGHKANYPGRGFGYIWFPFGPGAGRRRQEGLTQK